MPLSKKFLWGRCVMIYYIMIFISDWASYRLRFIIHLDDASLLLLNSQQFLHIYSNAQWLVLLFHTADYYRFTGYEFDFIMLDAQRDVASQYIDFGFNINSGRSMLARSLFLHASFYTYFLRMSISLIAEDCREEIAVKSWLAAKAWVEALPDLHNYWGAGHDFESFLRAATP